MNIEALVIVAAVLIGLAVLRYARRTPVKAGLVGNAHFTEIEHGDQLDKLFADSAGKKQVLYLHDPWCPVSGGALRQIQKLDTEVAIVDVSRYRELNDAIETRTGIRHESPQAFVIENGNVIWNASHGSINSLAVSLAVGNDPSAV